MRVVPFDATRPLKLRWTKFYFWGKLTITLVLFGLLLRRLTSFFLAAVL
jgi:hypothetical protein